MTSPDRKRDATEQEPAADVGGTSAIVNREGAALEMIVAQLREELEAANRERAQLEMRLRVITQRDSEDRDRAAEAQQRATEAQARAADAEARAAVARKRATVAEHELAVARRELQRALSQSSPSEAAITIYASRTRAWAHALARAAEMQRNAAATIEEVVSAMRRTPAPDESESESAPPESSASSSRPTARPLSSLIPSRTPPSVPAAPGSKPKGGGEEPK